MKLLLDVQAVSCEQVPSKEELRHWIAAALSERTTRQEVEIVVRLVDGDEMAQLNTNYRGKKGATNVLSFPADLPPDLELPLLGDIVICAPVVLEEAAQQGKTASAHWAHMAIHGTLHLLGYDHIEEDEAEVMEALESAILRQLDYSCPYQNQPQHERISV
ncbi:MAG: rRNA maturation RNase YbeY [Halioglobus sp.]|nr:rRNA maturation RNase YbeY [Halioglobus sp.]